MNLAVELDIYKIKQDRMSGRLRDNTTSKSEQYMMNKLCKEHDQMVNPMHVEYPGHSIQYTVRHRYVETGESHSSLGYQVFGAYIYIVHVGICGLDDHDVQVSLCTKYIDSWTGVDSFQVCRVIDCAWLCNDLQ